MKGSPLSLIAAWQRRTSSVFSVWGGPELDANSKKTEPNPNCGASGATVQVPHNGLVATANHPRVTDI